MKEKNLPQNVAIALFVKDEISDIAGWIAWHAALGVQTFFIYDDHSTDGTWEILQAAAKCYDVRLRRTDPLKTPHFGDRQRDAYMQTVQEAKGEFEWLGFLDGDEYLYLKHFDTLPEFLLYFPHADAIAFSWRIYGSSGRVIRPRIPIVEAFTQHSNKDFPDNLHVKSFVRPQKMGLKWFDPHYFDIPKEHYARPSRKFINIAGPKQEVEWSDAFIMHFICRSMEHYVQRIKRRLNADLSDSTDYWHYFDRNEENDPDPLRFIPKMQEKLAPIRREALKMAIQKLKDLPITPDPIYYSQKISEPKFEFFKILTHCQTMLYYAPQLGEAVHCLPEIAAVEKFLPIFGIVDKKTESLITLFIAGDDTNSLLKIPYDFRPSCRLLYRLVPQQNSGHALLNPISQRFICFLPPEANGIGKVEANREKAHDWEKIALFKTTFDLNFPLKKLPFNPSEKTSAHALLNWIKTASELPDAETFLQIFYCLSPKVRQEISNYASGLLWDFI
ncbi:glycosyltransferase [Acetobacteraceae bacterium]|nr:glycosyltransferase [Acetobacteraceae bacterium]